MLQDNTQALQALAATLNIPLSFNAYGVCDVVMNGDALITLEGDPQSTTLRINAVVGVLPEADSPQALRLLLQANFNGQGTGANSLGIDHVSDEVVLGRTVDVIHAGPRRPAATGARVRPLPALLAPQPAAPGIASVLAGAGRRRPHDEPEHARLRSLR